MKKSSLKIVLVVMALSVFMATFLNAEDSSHTRYPSFYPEIAITPTAHNGKGYFNYTGTFYLLNHSFFSAKAGYLTGESAEVNYRPINVAFAEFSAYPLSQDFVLMHLPIIPDFFTGQSRTIPFIHRPELFYQYFSGNDYNLGYAVEPFGFDISHHTVWIKYKSGSRYLNNLKSTDFQELEIGFGLNPNSRELAGKNIVIPLEFSAVANYSEPDQSTKAVPKLSAVGHLGIAHFKFFLEGKKYSIQNSNVDSGFQIDLFMLPALIDAFQNKHSDSNIYPITPDQKEIYAPSSNSTVLYWKNLNLFLKSNFGSATSELGISIEPIGFYEFPNKKTAFILTWGNYNKMQVAENSKLFFEVGLTTLVPL